MTKEQRLHVATSVHICCAGRRLDEVISQRAELRTDAAQPQAAAGPAAQRHRQGLATRPPHQLGWLGRVRQQVPFREAAAYLSLPAWAMQDQPFFSAQPTDADGDGRLRGAERREQRS